MADRVQGSFYLKLGELVSSGLEEAEEQEKVRLEAEQIRLFYVAATRARDYLVLPRFYKGAHPDSGRTWRRRRPSRQPPGRGLSPCRRAQPDRPGKLKRRPLIQRPEKDVPVDPDELVVRRHRWFDELER